MGGGAIRFDGLDAGKEYVARVAACNTERCGDAVNGSVWTSPAPPDFKESAAVAEATGNTVTIQLPLLANPPGWHYVAVEKERKGLQTSDENQMLMDGALDLVARQEEGNVTASQLLDILDSMYIAALVEQEGNERLQVTLGDDSVFDNRYKNHPLENDATYYAVVVTEKRNGPVVKRWANPPLRFEVAPEVHIGAVLGLILGMAVMVVVASVVAVVWLRKCSKKGVKKMETVHFSTVANHGKEEPPRQGVDASLSFNNDAVDELKLGPSWDAAKGFRAPPSKEDDTYLTPRPAVFSFPGTKGGAKM